jgi:hypothetical protein
MVLPQRMSSGEGDLALVVEKIQLLGYVGFWIIVLVGVILTRFFSHVNLQDTLLTQVFGYNNICVYFDYPPATYVLPLLWAVTLVLLLGYIATHWLQMRAEVQEGTLDRPLYRLLSGLKLLEAFTLVAFSTIFAVQPEGWNHTLYIHTVPFFLLQIGLVSLAMSNTLHGIQSGYWRRLALPTWFESAAKMYVIFFALVVGFKIPAAINAMAGSLWWEQTAAFIRVARWVDLLFLLCAAIIPMGKAAYFIWTRGDRLKVIHLATRTI